MAGALSSLGIGGGVLTYDVIDQLRAADEKVKIKPIEERKTKGQDQMTALSELIVSASEFKSSQNSLSEELTYLQRTTSVTGDEATIEVSGGVNPQTINLHIDQLAKQDILQTKRFATAETIAVYQATTLNVFIDETAYNIHLKAGMTLSEVAGELSAQTSYEKKNDDGTTTTTSALVGSALKVGGVDPYQLIIKSTTAGDENRILLGTTKMGDTYTSGFDFSSIGTGDMVINGVDVFKKQDGTAVDTSAYTSLTDVVDAINDKSYDTHVMAYLSKDEKKIIFNNADGMQIDFTGSDFATTGAMKKLGLTESKINSMGTTTTGTAISEDVGHSIIGGGIVNDSLSYATGDLLINGVDALDGYSGSSIDDIVSHINGNISDVIASNETYVRANSNVDTTKTLGTGDFIIKNGTKNIDMFEEDVTFSTIDELITMINDKTLDTGVTASKDGNKLLFKKQDGTTLDPSTAFVTTANGDSALGISGGTTDVDKLVLKNVSPNTSAISLTGSKLSSLGLNSTSNLYSQAGALFVNGVDVLNGASISSTQDMADSINKNFKETGVSAEIVSGKIKLNNSMGGAIYLDGSALSSLGLSSAEKSGVSVTGNTDVGYLGSNYRFDENDFKINSVNIFDDNTKPADMNALVTLINAKSAQTGVSVTSSGYDGSTHSGKLILSSTDGGSISFYGSQDDTLEHLGLFGADKSSPIAQNSFLKNMTLTHSDIYKYKLNNNGTSGDTSDDVYEYDGTGAARVQEPQDAEFFFNGVKVSRNTNEVDDLIVGATITLLKPNDSDSDIVKIEVKQDTDKLFTSFQESLEKYNALITKVKELTNYDATTKKSGALQGLTEITRLYTTLSNQFLSSDATLKQYPSLVSLGLSVDKKGVLAVDETKLKKAITDNPQEIEKLFRGYTAQYRGEDKFMDGLFTKMNATLKSFVTDDESVFNLYDKRLKDDDAKYDTEILKASEDLDSKYAIMSEKFSSYDSMMASMQQKFAPMQMMITQSLNG